VRVVLSKVRITGHVEVVVVDVEYFYRVLVHQCVRCWVTNDLAICVVNRALVVSVVQLCRTDQRIHARWIDVVSDLFLDDLNVVTLMLKEERHTTLNRVSSLKRPHDFVVTRRIQGDNFAAGRWAENRNACVTFFDVESVFLNLLEVWRNRDRNAEYTQ